MTRKMLKPVKKVSKSKKYFMKKVIVLVFLSFFCIAGFSQKHTILNTDDGDITVYIDEQGYSKITFTDTQWYTYVGD